MKEKETSYPRDKIKILLLENISDTACEGFVSGGYMPIERLPKALGEEELTRAVRDVHILGIRSKTRITSDVIASAEKLLAVGCFCIGVNQVDLKAASSHGVAVFNVPYSNTRSVAELVIGLCVMLIRKVVDKNAAAHRGVWLKDARSSYAHPAHTQKRSGRPGRNKLKALWPRHQHPGSIPEDQ